MTLLTAPLAGARPSQAVAALCADVFSRPFLRLPELATLRAHDAAHDSDYVATLAAYLDALGNVSTAAGRLGVHVNTFRYRVRRVVELSGLDLDDPDVRLVCGLELATPLPGEEGHVPDAPPVAVVAFRTSAWSDVTGHTVYSVVSASSQGALATTVQRIVREAEQALGARVVAGIGPVARGPVETEASRQLADDVLRAIGAGHAGPIASLDDVRTHVVLDAFAAAAAGWPDLDGGVVSRLAAHDDVHRTGYVESLHAYLTAFGDAAAAAAKVFVHVRTFRYRLRRIEALCGIRLDDPAARLAVALELRVRAAR